MTTQTEYIERLENVAAAARHLYANIADAEQNCNDDGVEFDDVAELHEALKTLDGTPAPSKRGLANEASKNWEVETRVPEGSADGVLCVVDANSDNRDVIAIVDPDGIRAELDGCAYQNAEIMALAPAMLEAMQDVIDNWATGDLAGAVQHCQAIIWEAESK